MSEESDDSKVSTPSLRRRTVVGTLAAGAGIAALGRSARGQEGGDDDLPGRPEWVPEDASEAHVAVLSGNQADVSTRAGGCAHVTPREAENTVVVDLVLEDVQCVTQAHIHEGERGESGPIVAPLVEYTGSPDGSGDGDPLTTEPDTPLIAGATVDDEDVVQALLENPGDYYVNVHTVHNPGGEIRGQIRGFDHGQETDIEPEPAEFTVSDLTPQDATVVQGDTVDVSARVHNDGDVEDSQTIELLIDGDVVAERDRDLMCRSSSTVTFADVDTGDLDPGDYTHEVRSEDDSATGSLTVLSPPDFQVAELDPTDVTVTRGDVIDVSATVENTGQATGTQTVEFRVDDAPLAEQELSLEGGESASVTFEDLDTSPLDPGEYEHGVFTDDDSETATLTVEEPSPAEFTVADLDPSDVTVTQGNVIDVSATIENVGDESATQTVEFRVDGTALAEQEVARDADESGSITFEGIDTAPLEPGEYEHGVFTTTDSETATLTVEAGATETPGTDEPGTETPGTDEPGTETPGTDEPGTETPGTDEPGTEAPGTETPGTEAPGTDEPGTEEPGTETPGTDEPGTSTSTDD